MSDRFRSTRMCYLIDHHSPQPPVVTLDCLDSAEYEEFIRISGVDSQMVYCKDHWGVSYYPSRVEGSQMHRGLKEDWIAVAADILRRNKVEFVAYYSIEYDEGAARRFPEWRVQKADGSYLIREDIYARWSLCCYQTGYRQYCLAQLREIVEDYRPDALFLDIFGASLCYCKNCRDKFYSKNGYPLPETEDELTAHKADVLTFLDENASEFMDDIRRETNRIDSTLAITVNFSCHYTASVRRKLDYQFSEPLLGDNWFSAAYARDTAEGQYPILAPGEASQVYNYSPVDKYRYDLHCIAAQGCRVGMYSGSQHIDGTLEMEEARRLGTVYREIAGMKEHLENRIPEECVGILQSDGSIKVGGGGVIADAILRAKVHNPHDKAILGAMRLCENAKLPWRILPEESLTGEIMRRYQLLIIPEAYVLSENTVLLLREFVTDGGGLLVSPNSGRFCDDGEVMENFALAGLMGVDFIRCREEYSRNGWAAYLVPSEGQKFTGLLGSTTPPIEKKFVEAALCGAESWLEFVLPCAEVTDTQWVNWWSPPPGRKSGIPALTYKKTGRGHAVFCAFDLFSMAEEGGYNCADELFAQLLERLEIRPIIRLETESPLLRYTGFFRRNKELLVHQISNLPRQFNGQTAPIPGGTLWVDTARFPVAAARMVWPVERELSTEKIEPGRCMIRLPDFTLGQVISLRSE